MKRILNIGIVVALGALATPVNAASSDTCDLIGSIAETTMTARLAGAPMKELGVDLHKAVDGMLPTWIDDMLISAYESPRYTTASARKEAISEFKNEWYLKCFKLTREKP